MQPEIVSDSLFALVSPVRALAAGRRTTRSFACRMLLAAAFVPASLAAQESAPSASSADFSLAAGDHDLRVMITAAAKFLGRNLLLPDRELMGDSTVALQVGQKLDRDGCLAVVTQLAYTQGLVIVPIDRDRGMWEFINLNGPRRGEAFTRAPSLAIADIRALKGVRTVVTTVFQVQHVRATVMVQLLRPFFATNGALSLILGSAGSDNAVVVSGLVDDVLNLETTIRSLDLPAKEKEPTSEERLQAVEAKLAALAAKVEASAKPAKD